MISYLKAEIFLWTYVMVIKTSMSLIIMTKEIKTDMCVTCCDTWVLDMLNFLFKKITKMISYLDGTILKCFYNYNNKKKWKITQYEGVWFL